MTVDEAYADVVRITQATARNFAWGIRVLPGPKRRAVAALYAFARAVDDLADREEPARAELERWKLSIAELPASPDGDAVLVALADAMRRYEIPKEALTDLVDGALMDCDRSRYGSWEELREYCRCVAGAVGVACAAVYQPSSWEAARPRAETLGLALQQINIMRDVPEDWSLGRVYLPQDELQRFGVEEEDIASGRGGPEWCALMEHQAARAETLMREGLELLPLLDRRSALCVRSFAGIYRGLLDQMRARDYDVFRERPHLSAVGKVQGGGDAMKAVVVGGGLAGLSAALQLLDWEHDVTLLEARPTLGGAVQTLPEREGDPDLPPDNGQHIALGCCYAYLDFLERIGQGSSVERRRLALPVIAEDGSVAFIGAGALALLRYRHVPLRDRLAIARVARRLGSLEPKDHDGETFAVLLRRLGQSEAAIDRFWDVFMRPALNLPSEEVSAGPALFTVQTALLADKRASDLVLPRRPLGEMHGEAAGRVLIERGALVRTNARVVELEQDAAVLADGERVHGDAFVLAVPSAESARLLGEPAPALEDSPIVSVHLLFDRRLLQHDLAALLGSRAHWVFDRGRLTGHEPERGQYLTVVSSGAPELLEVRGKELVELIAGEVTSRLGQAELLWSRVSREPSATFATKPGTARLRLGFATSRPNVARAGAWTDTGWPATMESAVRSGHEAACVFPPAWMKVAA